MSGTAALRPEAGAVTAGLHYTVDTGVKPVNETFGPNNIRRRVSGEHEVRHMQIRDGRPLAGEFSLDVTGFEFVGRHQAGAKDLAGVEVFALGGSESHHDLFGLAVARRDIVEDGIPGDVLGRL